MKTIKANFPSVLMKNGFDPKKELDDYLELQNRVVDAVTKWFLKEEKNKRESP